ncbi:MAG: ABC transporter permease subunit [Clostridia bacterium]|nr:ABC transporter permease subunit [Clostridia bacterium]
MHFFRMVKSEIRRLLSDKKFLYVLLFVLAIFITVITVYLLTVEMSPELPEKVDDFDKLLAGYQQNYEYYRSWHLYYIGEAARPEGVDPFFGGLGKGPKELMDYYQCMLTQTGWHPQFDFYYGFDFYYNSAAYRGVGSLFWIMRFAFYPLIIFAIITAVITCVSPYGKGIMKNYLAAPVGKRTVMGGKLFVSGLLNFAIWLIIFIWGLILGAGNASAHVLFYTGEKYYSQPILATFTLVMLQMLVAMLFTGILTVFIGQFIKKPLATGAAAVFVVIFILCLCGVSFQEAPWELVKYPDYGDQKYFPIISLYGLFHCAADYRLWVALSFHVAVGAGMAAFIILWQDKDFFISRRKRLTATE